MTLLDRLIATLDFDAPVRDIRLGVFHTAVLTRRCGLAASLPRSEIGKVLKRALREQYQAGALSSS